MHGESPLFCEKGGSKGLTSSNDLTSSIVPILGGNKDIVVKLHHLHDTWSWVCASKEDKFPEREEEKEKRLTAIRRQE